jgi:hypothetical protein
MTTTTTNNKSIESRYLANYIRNVQQASKGTAAQYEYRLLKFEKYIMTMPSKEEELTAATAAITAITTTTTTAAFVVILFVFLELILAGCRTEISSYTFNF